jgi:hypothetical protein
MMDLDRPGYRVRDPVKNMENSGDIRAENILQLLRFLQHSLNAGATLSSLVGIKWPLLFAVIWATRVVYPTFISATII